MKIAVIQIDGKMPNLALMKIASYYRDLGHEVIRFPSGDVDKAFISVIWPQNRGKAVGISKLFNGNCVIGGSGYSLKNDLPNDIEHMMPAYDLWGVDFSLGFTSRGCVRKCDFCIVPDKEGKIRSHSKVSEFHYPPHDKLILLDNNLLAAPNFNETISYIHDHNLKVNFNQGLDIRLVNDEIARSLAQVNYSNWRFHGKQIHFAFDDIRYEEKVRSGIEILLNAGIKPEHLMFYILVGFNSTFAEDMRRYEILWDEYRVYPYVQIYNNRKDDPKIRAFARWINRRIHKVASWGEYKRNPDLEVSS